MLKVSELPKLQPYAYSESHQIMEVLGFQEYAFYHEYLSIARLDALARALEIVRNTFGANRVWLRGRSPYNEQAYGRVRYRAMGAGTAERYGHYLDAVDSRSDDPFEGYRLPIEATESLLKVRKFEEWFVACLQDFVFPLSFGVLGSPAPYIQLVPLRGIPGALLDHPPFASVLEDLGGLIPCAF